MELIRGIDKWPGKKKDPLYLALGNFDGVHRGHQTIIKTAIRRACAAGGSSAALIFDPHPSMLLRADQPFALLTDIADRAELMAELGLDYLIVEPFTAALAAISPEQFTRLFLKERLAIDGAVIGSDYSFGCGGSGSAATLQHLGEILNFKVDVCPLLRHGDKIISSSEIRKLLGEGEVEEAAVLLNHYFMRRGRVIRGSGIGRRAVFPTANITSLPHLVWPGSGVYLTAVGGFAEGLRFGLTHVGDRPTFALKAMGVETHILDFDGELYARELSLTFLARLRPTQMFASAEQLKNQIIADREKTVNLIRNRFQNLIKDKKGFNRLWLP